MLGEGYWNKGPLYTRNQMQKGPLKKSRPVTTMLEMKHCLDAVRFRVNIQISVPAA